MYTDQKYNWENKAERAQAAQEHTKLMEERFSHEIQYSAARTSLYVDMPVNCRPSAKRKMNVAVRDMDSVSAVFSVSSGKTAVLNFSSHHFPGGCFLQGSRAQEECLCHESTLYNILSRFKDTFYGCNEANRHLYKNRALYTPEVVFLHQGKADIAVRKRYCDVITCACPNKRAAQSYKGVTDEENTAALTSRIRFVLDIAEQENVDTLILGAYGCGVFGQDPIEVASIFKAELETRDFRQVVFAIPAGPNENLKAFKTVFC